MRIQAKFTHGAFINRKENFAMNSKRKVTALIFLVAIIMMVSNLVAQEALVGSWALKVTNTTFGITFEDLRTYHADGILTEVNSGHITESAGHGVWARQGNGYADTFVVFEFDSSGNLIGKVRIRTTITLIGADSLTQTWQADFILLDGSVIPNVAQGTGRGSRIRLQTLTAVNESSHNAPASFELQQNYPNPFNPSTTIRFEVAQASYVNLKVLDTLGREVRTLVDRSYGPGSYFQVWDGKDNRNLSAPSGTYFLRMNAGGYVDTKKMTLIK
jgi:hypothetical protein